MTLNQSILLPTPSHSVETSAKVMETTQRVETPTPDKASGPLATVNAQADELDFATSSPPEYTPPGFKAWVESRAHEIQSLASDDFSDLQFLEPILDGKRIIQLGEDDHRTREQSLMKVRLIQYLHQELGYEVIAFESGLLDCYLTYQQIENYAPQDAMERSIHGVWYTEAVFPLFEYLLDTSNSSSPLILAGFDIQPSGLKFDASADFYYELLVDLDREYAREIKTLEESPPVGRPEDWDKPVREMLEYEKKVLYEGLVRYFEEHAEVMDDSFPKYPEAVAAARQGAWSRARYIEQISAEHSRYESLNIRDQGMAQNVKFLAEELYPNKKIIIWAANKHITKSPSEEHWKNMGVYLADHFGDSLYTIGLFGYRPPTIGEGLIDLLHIYGSPYLFLELEQPDTSGESRFQPRLLNYQYSPDVYYDGLIFLDQISYPEYLPENE
jgi:erythromycin esterase